MWDMNRARVCQRLILLRPAPRRWMTLALRSTLNVTVKAVSQLSPPLPTEGPVQVSARRSVYLIDRYGLLRLP